MRTHLRRLAALAVPGLSGFALALMLAGGSRDTDRGAPAAGVAHGGTAPRAVTALRDDVTVPARPMRSITARRGVHPAPEPMLAARTVTLARAVLAGRAPDTDAGRVARAHAPHAPIRAPPAA